MKLFKRYQHEMLLLVIFVLVLLPLFFYSCQTFNEWGFDSINILYWQKLSVTGFVPYRDFFYPYGLLNYYYTSSILAKGIFVFVFSLYLLVSYKFTRYYSRGRVESLALFFLLLSFIFFVSGPENFVRNGSLLVYCIVYSAVLFPFHKISSLYVFAIGILTGLLFSLMLDQGIYSLILFFIIISFSFLIKILSNKKIAKENGIKLLKQSSFFILGSTIGIIPLLFFLMTIGAVSSFIDNLLIISKMSNFAKIPFFPSLRSFEGIIILAGLISSLLFIAVALSRRGKEITKREFILSGVFLALLLLMQKSIVRPINDQLVIYSLFIFISLGGIFASTVNKKSTTIYSTLTLILLTAIVVMTTFTTTKFTSYEFLGMLKSVMDNAGKKCFEKNYSHLASTLNYSSLNRYLQESNTSSFVFPLFSLSLLENQQEVPYFPNLYDATLESSQEMIVAYLTRNDIEEVLIDTENLSIQDNVPDYVRGNYLLSFIINNYIISNKVGSFLILNKKTNNEGFFNSKKFNSELKNEYLEHLKKVHFQTIPRSEGRKFLAAEDLNVEYLLKNATIGKLNELLAESEEESENLFLIVHGNKKKSDIDKFLFTNSKGIQSEFSFSACEIENVCVISIKRIPIFFENDVRILKITADESQRYSLVKTDSQYLW